MWTGKKSTWLISSTILDILFLSWAQTIWFLIVWFLHAIVEQVYGIHNIRLHCFQIFNVLYTFIILFWKETLSSRLFWHCIIITGTCGIILLLNSFREILRTTTLIFHILTRLSWSIPTQSYLILNKTVKPNLGFYFCLQLLFLHKLLLNSFSVIFLSPNYISGYILFHF